MKKLIVLLFMVIAFGQEVEVDTVMVNNKLSELKERHATVVKEIQRLETMKTNIEYTYIEFIGMLPKEEKEDE